MSVDPLAPKYPFLTPYQYSSNDPIGNVDEDGLEANPDTNNSPQQPDSLYCHYNRGYVKEYMKDYKGAIADYTKAIYHDYAVNILAHAGRARCKEYIQDYNGAIVDYTKIINAYPHAQPAYYDRGLLRLKINDKKGACEDFKTAKKLGCTENDIEKLIKKSCKGQR